MAKKKESVEQTVRNIRRKTRKQYSSEEKIRIVLEGLRGESTVAELDTCRCIIKLWRGKSPLNCIPLCPNCFEDVHYMRSL